MTTESRLELLLRKPWTFWTRVFYGSTLLSLLAILGSLCITGLLFILLPEDYALIGIGLFFFWIGPILLEIPWIFYWFIVPNAQTGDWGLPIGCKRSKLLGEVICI